MESNMSMFSSRRSKVLIATFTTLGIVGVAVCVIMVVLPSAGSKITNENVIDRAAPSELPKQVFSEDKDVEYALNSSKVNFHQMTKVLRRASNRLVRKARAIHNSNFKKSGGEDAASCVSSSSNTTIPVAHVHGRGLRPFARSTSRSSITRKGFQQKWRCNGYFDRGGLHAFVDGGMVFNQTEKYLRVPSCGYYQVTSQILFDINDTVREPTSVFHLLKFQSNCLHGGTDELGVADWIMVATKGSRVTTHTSDVFHLCAGGKIWVEIPDGRNRNLCCPMGNEDSTFLSAYMVFPTNCAWPPTITNQF